MLQLLLNAAAICLGLSVGMSNRFFCKTDIKKMMSVYLIDKKPRDDWANQASIQGYSRRRLYEILEAASTVSRPSRLAFVGRLKAY